MRTYFLAMGFRRLRRLPLEQFGIEEIWTRNVALDPNRGREFSDRDFIGRLPASGLDSPDVVFLPHFRNSTEYCRLTIDRIVSRQPSAL